MTENWKKQLVGFALVAAIGIATGYGVATISGSRKSNAPTDVKSAREEFIRAQQNYMAALKVEREGNQKSEVSGQRSVNAVRPSPVVGRPSPAAGHPSSVPGQSSPASGPSSVSGPSSPVVGPKSGTLIAFDENVADFGTVDQGTESVKVFIYRNKGNQTLRISDVTSTCGCTVAQPEPKVLPPGAMGRLRVSFKSGGFSGPVSKTITMRSNDPSTPALALGVKANVRTLFAMEEKVVKLGEIEHGKPALREITIKPLTSELFQIQRIMPTHPELRGDVLPAGKSGDRAMHLLVSMNSNRNCGLFTYALRLYIARPQAAAGAQKMLELVIPVTGTVVGAARVKPDAIFFGSVKQGERFKSQKLVLTSRNGKPVEVKSVDTGFEGMKAVVKAVKPGMEYEIELTDAAPPPEGFFQRTLQILTSDSNVPIEVKLSGVVMKAL